MVVYKDILINIGLNEKEALTYEALLEIGASTVVSLSKKTRLKRGNLYDILDMLIRSGVVEKVIKGKTTYFQTTPPENLKNIIEDKEQNIKNAKLSLDHSMDGIKSLYSLNTQKPSIFYYEGLEGLEKIYNDVLKEGKDILLLRSVFDNDHPEIKGLVKKQIEKQIEKNIHVKAVTPMPENTPSLEHWGKDKERFFERRVLPRKDFFLPAQIIIYGNKVAITDLKDSLVSTLIENESIAETFKIIFNNIWTLSEEVHQKITKTAR